MTPNTRFLPSRIAYKRKTGSGWEKVAGRGRSWLKTHSRAYITRTLPVHDLRRTLPVHYSCESIRVVVLRCSGGLSHKPRRGQAGSGRTTVQYHDHQNTDLANWMPKWSISGGKLFWKTFPKWRFFIFPLVEHPDKLSVRGWK